MLNRATFWLVFDTGAPTNPPGLPLTLQVLALDKMSASLLVRRLLGSSGALIVVPDTSRLTLRLRFVVCGRVGVSRIPSERGLTYAGAYQAGLARGVFAALSLTVSCLGFVHPQMFRCTGEC